MISFKNINKENYMECISLKVKAAQCDFVADNAQSLLDAHYLEGLETFGIYHTFVAFPTDLSPWLYYNIGSTVKLSLFCACLCILFLCLKMADQIGSPRKLARQPNQTTQKRILL